MSTFHSTRQSALKLNVAARALIVAGTLALGATYGSASAQTAQGPGASNDRETETVVVTGSRIQRRDADSVGLLLTLTRQDIAASGASSIGDLVQKLPSAGVSLNSNGTQGTSFGASSINLRYLGGGEGSGNRVLVLVDGRRWVDGVGQRGFRDFVDLNTMPLGMVEGIEVLKDGASAVYGADAIAGVVNIKTLRDFDGLRLSGKVGATTEGDGEQFSASANWGQRFASGRLVLSASYSKDDPIDTTARDFTRQSLVPVSAPSTSPRGLYILPGLSANTFFGTPTGFGTSASPITAVALSQYGPGNQADNSFRVATLPADAFNTLAQGLYSVGPSERYGLYGRYSADVSDTIQLKIEGLYNRRKSDQLFSPVLLDIGGTSGTIRGFSIPNNHQFNPFGSANGVPTANALAFNTNSAWRVRRVMDDVGNRRNVQDVTTVRFAMGLEGQAKFFDRDWNWDLFASASKNSMDSSALNGINYDRLALGLGNTTVCATTAGCVPVNLFAPMSAEAANYIRFTTIESNFNQMTNFAFNVSGDIFTLPAGPVSMAAGLERRTNSAGDTPDAFANTPPSNLPAIYTTTTAQTRTPTRGSYTLNEAYVEFALPLLKDVPLANSLDLSFAARYSDYDTVGDATTIKVGAGWKPIEDVLVRATFSQGFRAPSILELYQGARETSFQGTDPCNGGAAAKPNLPGCVGVPSGYNQANFNLNGLIPGTISGNLNLKPETADTTTFGIAIKPRLVPGLSLTLDWFEITITDAIASQSATQILNLCSVQGGVFCALISRDTGTGAVLRLLQGAQNLNEIKTSGIDTTLRYDFNTGFGRFSAVLDGSYLEEFSSTSPNPTGGPPIVDDRVGKGDAPRSTFPKWKGQASVRWNNDNWNAVWRGRYIGETTDVVNAVKDNKTKAVFYQDAEFGYKFEQYDTTIGIGINNIFDETPPLSYANAPINYDIYTYDARGRVIYAKFGFQF